MMLKQLWLVAPIVASINCLPYVYHMRERVLVSGIDVDSTLEIVRTELEEGGFDATLAIWAIRDQSVSVENARTILALYFKHIDAVAAEKDKTTAAFGVWHFSWAISNLYRNGDEGIKAELEDAYRDALKRPAGLTTFKDVAAEHVGGNKVYMGDFHAAARAYARSHIVAPGVKGYLQSLDEYRKNKAKEKKSTMATAATSERRWQ
jgi:hypothetical protein